MSEMEEFHPENPYVQAGAEALRHLDELIDSVDERLARMRPEIELLMEARHKLAQDKSYELPNSLFDVARPTLEQLYDEPTYNDVFVYGYDPRVKVIDDDPAAGGDLSARRGAEFHNGESYEEGEYAQAVFDVADRLGFVKKQLGHASDRLDAQIGIADSDLEPVGEVEAVVVPGAASFSNVMRLRDALRNIEQGRVQTDTLIIATTDREVKQPELDKVEAVGFRGAATEFDSLVTELSQLINAPIDQSTTEALSVKLGKNSFEGKLLRVNVKIAGKPLECVFVSAPFDPERVVRWDKDGNPVQAVRSNTDEAFVSALSLLKPGPGKILIESHDTWAIGQGIVAEQIFGVAGKEVIATGPRKLDRVVEKTDEQGRSYLSLTRPQEVVDEIAKTYAFLTQTRIKADNERRRIQERTGTTDALGAVALSE